MSKNSRTRMIERETRRVASLAVQHAAVCPEAGELRSAIRKLAKYVNPSLVGGRVVDLLEALGTGVED